MFIKDITTISTILQISGILLDIAGVLLIMYSDGKKIHLKADSLADKIAPLLSKSAVVSPTTLFNEKHGHNHNKRMRLLKIIGIIMVVVGAILLIFALSIVLINHINPS